MVLDKKVAVVSGASSGLGSAIVKALVKKNVEVYGLARNYDKLKKMRYKLGGLFHPVEMDITVEKAVVDWASNEFNDQKKPDILINNAGSGSFGKIDELPTSEWHQMINTNLNGMYYLTSQLVPFMKEKDSHSHIINIGSILGTMGRSEGTAYCASKFGTQGFSDALFKELREFNIKVSTLNPGSIDTGFFQSSGIDAHHNMLQPKDLANTIIHLLETPDNMLISELTIRPLNPKKDN